MHHKTVLRWSAAVVVGLLAIGACNDDTAVGPKTAPTKPSLLFAGGDNFNGTGACLAHDAAYAGFTNGVNGDTTVLASSHCTAKDIKVAHADLIEFSTDGTNFTPYTGQTVTCNEGDSLWVHLHTDIHQTDNSQRTDIGLWIATDGGNARTGTCNQYNLIPPSFSNIDSLGVWNIDGDHCGDMNAADSTEVDIGTIKVLCQTATTATTSLHVGSCIGWTQPGGNQACPQGGNETETGYRYGTVPGTTSKCNCEGFDIGITVNRSAYLEVKKACDPTTDTGTFDLLIDASNQFADNVNCGGTTGKQKLSAGTNLSPGATHTFGEGDFTTANYTSSYSCVNRSASGPQHTFGSNGDAAGTGTNLGPNQITLQPNEDVVCTYTNVRKPSLTLVKRVVNDNGGTKAVGDFGITTSAGSLTFGSGAADGANTLKYTSNTFVLDTAGKYTFKENDVTGYDEGTWACTGAAGTVVSTYSAGSVVIANGETVTCTITNNDQGSTLQLVKRIVNDNGGAKTVSDFGITTDAGALTFGSGVADGANTLKYTATALNVNAGTYSLVENDVTGYTEGSWSCTGNSGSVTSTFSAGSVTIGLGETVVCTITNDDQPGSLQLVKRVVNDNAGTKTVSDFGVTTSAGSLTFDGGVADGANTIKYTSNVLTGLSAGSYTLRESDIAGYTEGTWSCTGATPSNTSIDQGAVTVPNGGAVVCTITNDDSQGSLTIVKRIVNAYGGTKTVSDFSITTNAGSLSFGSGAPDGTNTLKYTATALSVNAGTYTLVETDVGGYTEGSWGCTGAAGTVVSTFNAGSVVIGNGESVTCTITNSDQPASLTIVKRIINDNGGTMVVGDFSIGTSAGSLTFGSGVSDGANTLKYTSNTLNNLSAGAKTLHEIAVTGYTEGTWSCTGGTVTNNTATGGSVTLANGDNVTCTITNDDAGSTLQLVKRVVNDNGGTKTVSDFGITTNAGTLTFGSGVSDGTNTLKYTATALNVNAGTYSLVENDVTGYTEGSWSCTGNAGAVTSTFSAGSVVVGLGETVVCTITNNDAAASLTIVKRIVNDNGGTKVVGDFGLNTTAGSLTFGSGVSDGANTLKYTSTAITGLSAGAYTLRESDLSDYTEGTWSCTAGTVTNTGATTGSVTLDNGQSATCTITNDDIAQGRGAIAPTQTTCQDFVANNYTPIPSLLAQTKGNTINSISPGVFFYYATVSKATQAASVSFTETRTWAGSGTAPFYDVQNGQAYLYDSSCNRVSTLTLQSTVGNTRTWSDGSGLPAGDYILGVKFDATSASSGPANSLSWTHIFQLLDGSSKTQISTIKKKQ